MIKVCFIYDRKTSFVQKDCVLLGKNYDLHEYHFKFKTKPQVVIAYLKMLLFLVFKGRSFHVFIAQFAGHGSLLPSIFGKFYKIPCLIFVAGTDAAYFPGIKYGNYYRSFQRFATDISLRLCTYISPCHESLVCQDYSYYEGGMPRQGYKVFYPKAKAKPYKCIPYGFDPGFFKRNINTERIETSFLTIGNMSVSTLFFRKGYDLIIAVAPLFPDCTFTLAGAPKEFVLHDCPQNVTFLPFLSHADLIDLFSKHQFYFQISIMEGFPNALCEAMLCECIPIGSDVSGIPEIIGDTGYILKKRSLEELAEIIKCAISLSPSQKLQMGAEARKKIANNYSNEKRENDLKDLLSDILVSYAGNKQI